MTNRSITLCDALCPTDSVQVIRNSQGFTTLVVRDGLLKQDAIAYLSPRDTKRLACLLMGYVNAADPRTQGDFTPEGEGL